MKTTQSFLARYRWILALAGGLAVYLLYPQSLPYLLFGGMMLMHLGGHGGHGGHRHDSQPRQDHPHGPNPQRLDYQAGVEAHQHQETAQAANKPHRGCH